MITRRTALGLFATSSAALALGGCGYRSASLRYRLTVEVDTPEGLKSGSSVIAVKLSDPGEGKWLPPEARRVNAELHGEAVAVELPGGQVLFALLRTEADSDGAMWFAYRAVETPPFEGEYAGIRRTEYMNEHRMSGELPRKLPPVGHLPERSGYPMLVRFADISDPKTVERVDPDNLAASFGKGVTLRRITVQVTEDAVTTGIEKRLGWLEAVGRQRGTLIPDPPRLLKNSRPIHLLAPSDFTSELYK